MNSHRGANAVTPSVQARKIFLPVVCKNCERGPAVHALNTVDQLACLVGKLRSPTNLLGFPVNPRGGAATRMQQRLQEDNAL